MTLTHCTLVKNTSPPQGGAVSQISVTGGTASITLTSNIIAENTASLSPDVRLAQGTGTSQGTNLIGNATDSGINWLGSDLTGNSTAPLRIVWPLWDTVVAPHRPARLCSAARRWMLHPHSAFSTDQRGLPRVVDADGIGGALADIGAVESKFVQVDVAADELESPVGENDVSLRAALRAGPEGGMITTLAFLDLAARACPRRAEATFFALLMAIFNLCTLASQNVGAHLYTELGEGSFAYIWLVVISSFATATIWLLVPMIHIERIEARAQRRR